MQATHAGEAESSDAALASTKEPVSDPMMNNPPPLEVVNECLSRDRADSLEQEVSTIQDGLAAAEKSTARAESTDVDV